MAPFRANRNSFASFRPHLSVLRTVAAISLSVELNVWFRIQLLLFSRRNSYEKAKILVAKFVWSVRVCTCHRRRESPLFPETICRIKSSFICRKIGYVVEVFRHCPGILFVQMTRGRHHPGRAITGNKSRFSRQSRSDVTISGSVECRIAR